MRVEHAPTAFGEVSLKLTSKLRRGVVLAELELPQRNPARRALLRIRLPDGWRAESATLGKVRLPLDGRGTVELPSAAGRVSVRFEVKPAG